MKKAMLSTLAWAAFAFAVAGAVQANDHGEQWTLANEYPANSLSGEGDAYFARLVPQKSQGKLSPGDIATLKIRTYDKAGTDVFARLGAKASVVSFTDLPAKLASGEIDAVLSSGDGGAGRKLWEHLPRFTAINYAIPLSFTTVNADRWKALDDATRDALMEAAAETEARQWRALDGRL